MPILKVLQTCQRTHFITTGQFSTQGCLIACRPFRCKPLTKPIMAYCRKVINSTQSKIFHWRKFIWKWRFHTARLCQIYHLIVWQNLMHFFKRMQYWSFNRLLSCSGNGQCHLRCARVNTKRISNHTLGFVWDVVDNPCHNVNDTLTKPPFQ